MATPIVCDHAEPALREEEHLAIPGVRAERPSVREGDYRALAPVLVIDLRSVASRDCRHEILLRFEARSFSLPLPVYPFADVARAVAQRHAIRLAGPEETNGLDVYERHLFEVEDQ